MAPSSGEFSDMTHPDVYIESFLIDSWAEHLRQHERITVIDRTVEDLALSFHIDNQPPVVSHFIAVVFSSKRCYYV